MPNTLNVPYINAATYDLTGRVPVKDLRIRVIQHYQASYASEWNPDNNYNWIPGAYRDMTPRRADSRIRFTMRIPVAWVAASHAISHWKLFADGLEYFRWSVSGTHLERGDTYEFEVPSWGTYSSRIGLQMRSYANDNHELRAYTTYYWNGTGRVAIGAQGQMIVQEILN
jgi:hypothetical protein